MKIGMVLDKQFPVDDRVEKEATSLIRAGFEVHILSFTFGKLARNEIYKGIYIHRVFMPEKVYKKLSALILLIPFYNWFWGIHINKFIKNNKINVLHIHDLPLVGVALKIAKRKNLPVVADMHENYPDFIAVAGYANTPLGKLLINKKKWALKEKQWLKKADYIVTVAQEMKSRIAKFVKDENKIFVVQNTISMAAFMIRQEKNQTIEEKYKDNFVVLYFGGIDEIRGIETLIHSAVYIKNKIYKLKIVIIGQGKLLNNLKKLTEDLSAGDVVSFEGWQNVKHLNSYMKNSNICVIPHLKSPQTDNSSPNKLYIYMLFAKAIISSNCASIQKIIEENNCGLVYESGNYKELADKIYTLYKNYDLRIKLGKNGYEAVKSKYDWEITAENLISMYKKIESN